MSNIKHVCGGRAHVVGNVLVHGWNKYCCDRCGQVFFHWLTEKMAKAN
jgi:hypothetical protein